MRSINPYANKIKNCNMLADCRSQSLAIQKRTERTYLNLWMWDCGLLGVVCGTGMRDCGFCSILFVFTPIYSHFDQKGCFLCLFLSDFVRFGIKAQKALKYAFWHILGLLCVFVWIWKDVRLKRSKMGLFFVFRLVFVHYSC